MDGFNGKHVFSDLEHYFYFFCGVFSINHHGNMLLCCIKIVKCCFLLIFIVLVMSNCCGYGETNYFYKMILKHHPDWRTKLLNVFCDPSSFILSAYILHYMYVVRFLGVMVCISSIDCTVQCGSFFTGTLFAYGQTSSGKTYTMMGDQCTEGVIPKAVGEIYEYIEKVRYMYS